MGQSEYNEQILVQNKQSKQIENQIKPNQKIG